MLRRETHFGNRLVRCFADRPASVQAMFDAALARFPDRTALVYEGRRWSWRELDTHVAALSAAFSARGVAAGDRVCLLLSNRPEFVWVLYALMRLGAIAVPVSVREQAPGLAFILGQCQARGIVYEDELADRLPEGLELALPAGSIEALIAATHHELAAARRASPPREPAAAPAPAATAARTAPSMVKAAPTVPAASPVHEEDTAVILYTSGTTGRPKGAMLTHFNLVHSVMHFEQSMALTADDVSAMAVPASHVTGLVAMILTMLRVGGALVIVPQFKAGPFLELAARERITHTILVPAMYALCLLEPDFERHDLAAWRIGCYGGAPMPEATIEALARKLPGMTLMNAYGATETTSPTTIMPIGEQAAHLDSVGKAVACAEVVVVDDEGRELPAGEPGELLIGGPMVVAGYWDNPEANAASFVAGFWRSGDIGSVDAQGYVRIFDRKKDMINRGGYKIWSIEVENALMACEGIIEAAAVGVPCPVLGERVHAFVHASPHARANAALEPEALRRWCAERLADYKVPERIVFCEAPLPRNANGKVLKRQLRERA